MAWILPELASSFRGPRTQKERLSQSTAIHGFPRTPDNFESIDSTSGEPHNNVRGRRRLGTVVERAARSSWGPPPCRPARCCSVFCSPLPPPPYRQNAQS